MEEDPTIRDGGRIFSTEIELAKDRGCEVVPSWKDVVTKQNEGSPLLVIQEAHGYRGGEADVDGGDEDANEIFTEISRLSKTRPLAVYQRSCFSGDDLVEFLVRRNDLHSQVCLMTQSVPN